MDIAICIFKTRFCRVKPYTSKCCNVFWFIVHLFCQLFCSSIDIDIACRNTVLNWTCPGGYIKEHDAIWQTVYEKICMKTSTGKLGRFHVTTHMKNKCDNKAPCSFTVKDSSFGVSCEEKCSGLSYAYECVSKSLVQYSFNYFNQFYKETIYAISK